MNNARTRTQDRLQLPGTLRAQLNDFRLQVWTVKTIEAVAAAGFGVVVAFLVLFAVDRAWEAPGWLRAVLFAAALIGCANVPRMLYQWVWRQRRPDQLARLLGRERPRIGDPLLGVIELEQSDSEQARSRALCEAAIRQVAEETRKWNLRDAVPHPRHRLWCWLFAVPGALALGLLLIVPAAAVNAWARLAAPWRAVPRYTFAALEPMPGRLVVPHGEPFSIAVRLQPRSAWRPARGIARLGQQTPVAARIEDGQFDFAMPAQIDPGLVEIQIGDALRQLRIEPTLRPELTSIVADVTLPEYLGRPRPERKDVRGGTIALVKGSRAQFAATASRTLATAHVDGQARRPAGATVSSAPAVVSGPLSIEFRWRDTFGLTGKEPFTLAIDGRDDEPPSLVCEDLPRQKVVLDSEALSFKIKSQDDFAVKRVGIEWHGIESPIVPRPARGERVLAAGAIDRDTLEAAGTFSAKSLDIEPQPIRLRVFAEDYLPGRARVYSPPYTLFVLNAEMHAIWVTEQLSKWHRHSLEVRDREMVLHETNKQLRALAAEELDRPDTRRRIENQALAEQANGRRLSGLVVAGEDLVRQAMRNPEIGVGHLEKWAEMLQILKDIAGNRMPTVADLLKQASSAPSVAANTPGQPTKMAGQIRAGGSGKPSETTKDGPKPGPVVPQVVDRESSQQPPPKDSDEAPSPSGTKMPRQGLPTTTLAGGKSKPGDPPSPAEQNVEEAVTTQQDLLAEFEKIADELNRVLANLEGSTLVKRLKAASRLQYQIAGGIATHVGDTFGIPPTRQEGGAVKKLDALSEQEARGGHDVSLIMDDMQSYFERRGFLQVKTVLDDMKKQDVIGGLRQIGDDLRREKGLAISQCEFWSDTLDRWAEDLVDPASAGACPGSKSRSSLPPSVVLEVLQILEGEVNLREETRVAEQARPALEAEDHSRQAGKLSGTQKDLRERVDRVTDRIRELPDSEAEFSREILLLGEVSEVMTDATGILARPETGGPAIAAETEAIELLLQSRRINPRGGGGGGASPGGGGTGTTHDSALALVGAGLNDKEVREDRGVAQATGDAGPALPEEFRAGLDEYFKRLESRPGTE
jgi:hypothetical protein